MEPEFTIANDFDPDGDMSSNADPMAEYLTYLADVRGSAVGDMGFSLACRTSENTLPAYGNIQGVEIAGDS